MIWLRKSYVIKPNKTMERNLFNICNIQKYFQVMYRITQSQLVNLVLLICPILLALSLNKKYMNKQMLSTSISNKQTELKNILDNYKYHTYMVIGLLIIGNLLGGLDSYTTGTPLPVPQRGGPKVP